MIGPTPAIEGIGMHMRDLTNELRRANHNVTIIPRYGNRSVYHSLNPSFLCYFSKLIGNFEIAHTQGFVPSALLAESLAKRALRLRIVCTIHGDIPTLDHPTRYVTREVLREFDCIVCVSDWVRKEMARFAGRNPPRLVTIYNGVNTSVFNPAIDPAPFRKRFRLEGKTAILYVGRLESHKGVHYLLQSMPEVCSQIPGAVLVLCGEGKQRQRLLEMSKFLHLERNVIFAGFVAHEMLPSYFAGADMCVMPSTYEGFGIAVLEGMSSGKPVVASNVGGIPEMIDHGRNGLLISPKNSSEIANAICLLHSDTALSRKLASEARLTALDRFTWDRIAGQTLDMYREILL